MTGALAGFRILDLSRVLAGPYCSMIFGDLGAEVIKVEAPGGSDETRHWGPPFQEGVSAYYLSANRNKESITLDLRTVEGQEQFKDLVKTSDVVLHNFKTGTMERFGLGYESLAALNPRLVFCSITGFGETGPLKDLPGYDFILQGMSGLMQITGTPESGPQKMGVAIVDILTGLYACIGIQAALLERHTSGKGQKLDLSLYDCAVSSLVNIGSNYLMTGKEPLRRGNTHAQIAPYQTFEAKDGLLIVAVGTNIQFKALCDLVGWKPPECFATNAGRVENRETLTSILQLYLKEQTVSMWVEQMRAVGIPCGPVQTFEQLTNDPQLAHRNMWVTQTHPVAGTIRLIGSPLHLSRTPVTYRLAPPEPGQHQTKWIKRREHS
ncbi:CoA transferase [Chryseomicrobium excrementi]|uniref:CoA transferase n=1 Tax=Chryseomicrobium excrementi TaxID=2041346 RepID=A0A2M9EZK7_9BACL|nr:CoA transferase [Chryseomicrobium excrementi]PJK16646.1 CoA transferase [Chryseomicrobium excrementi]